MATISKKEVHKFLDKHPDIPFSAAKFHILSLKLLNMPMRFQRKPLSGGN